MIWFFADFEQSCISQMRKQDMPAFSHPGNISCQCSQLVYLVVKLSESLYAEKAVEH